MERPSTSSSIELQTWSAHDLRVVRKLLWDVICDLLKPAERDEVKRALGHATIDDNEVLFAEASALADILGDVQLTTKSLLARQQLCNNPQRRMVEAEISILLDRLRGVATAAAFSGSAAKERDPESVLPKAGPKDKAIYDYVIASSASQSSSNGRPRSALGRPGTASSRPTTASSISRPSTASSGSGSQGYDATSIVATMQDKLNVYEIDAVKEVLKNALQDEKQALMEDVEYLMSLLDEETDVQSKAVAPPSLVELKEYSSKLQEAVVAEEARLEHEQRVSSMFAAAESEASKAGRLRRMVCASRNPADVAPAATANVLTVTHPPTSTPASVPRSSSASACSQHASQQTANGSHLLGSPQPSNRPGSGTGTTPPRALLPPRPVSGPSTAASTAVGKPRTLPASASGKVNGTSSGSSIMGTPQVSSQAQGRPDPDSAASVSGRISQSEQRLCGDMPAPLSSPLLLRPPSSSQRAGDGILAAAEQLAALRTAQSAGSGNEPSASSPRQGLAGTSSSTPAGTQGTSSPHIERGGSGRVRPSSPARLRALVSQDVTGLITSVPANNSAGERLGPSNSSAMSVQQPASQIEARPALSTGRLQGQGSTNMFTAHGSKIARDVGSLLDAQAGAAIGGVAAILAKHNYSMKGTTNRAQPAPGT